MDGDTMEQVIQAAGMVKRFGALRAVDGVTLQVGRGEIFGLLGPNAAGKSTTIRMLAGILAIDAGSARIMGLDLISCREQVKAGIGYVAQSFALYPELTVAENLDFYSAIYREVDAERKQRLLKAYGLETFAAQRAGELSGGYKRRLSIVCALAHDPQLIFLDEPTAGIDPVTRKELWEQFYALAAEGRTLFVTTHYMEEAERCHRLAFLNHGRIVAEGTPVSILAAFGDRRIFVVDCAHRAGLATALAALSGVVSLNPFGNSMRVITDASLDELALRQVVQRYADPDIAVRHEHPVIEDVFIAMTHEEV